MSEQSSKCLETLEPIASGIVAEHAARVDKEGRFPEEAIRALGAAGLMGLVSAKDVGGLGEGHRAAALVVERLAKECASTAMVVCMHYSGALVLEKHGPESVRRDVASGKHLSTLAFSEAGSRSQFWAPTSTATQSGSSVRLDAKKSWATSAGHATAYVWSSRPVAAQGASTIWLVPASAKGIKLDGGFDGLGLRGNDSRPITADGVVVPESARLGADGGGLSVMLDIVLPIFNVMNAACSIGLMETATQKTTAHAAGTRFQHDGAAIADLPTVRAYAARMRIKTDMARTLLLDALTALETGRGDVMLRVLECKAAAGELATEVTDLGMRVCGGAAFRRDVGVERQFRDARAATVMAPTTDALYDFIGKAVCGLPVF
jgi:alkylation response protein AidB-like acyl-CoA dehydrogenase